MVRDPKAAAAGPVPRSLTLGARLVSCGAITREQLEEALEAQAIFGGRLGTNLLELGYIDERTLNRVLAEKHHVPTLEEGVVDPAPDPKILELIPPELIRKYRVFPVRLDQRRLHVLMEDPSLLAQIDDLSFRTGLIICPCVASEARIAYLLERYYKIRREQRYVLLADDRGRPAREEAPPREVESASEAMRLNWFASAEPEKKEEEVWDLTEEEELCPEDIHFDLMSKAEPSAPDTAAPSRDARGDGNPREIARNPEALPSLPDLQDGPLGRRLKKAARRIAEGAQPAAPLSVKEAVARLARVESRDEVAEILLDLARTRCRRAALFLMQRDTIFGWDAAGDGVDPARMRVLRIPAGAIAMFRNTLDAKAPLVCNPALDADRPEMGRFAAALGGKVARSALLVPIVIRDRAVNLFYADNGPDGEAPDRVDEILEALRAVPLAFAALLRRRKEMVTD